MLNLSKLRVALIGLGDQLSRRQELLQQAGAKNLSVFEPNEEIEFKNFDVVMIVNAPNDAELFEKAKAAGCIVNVEDKKEFCDFYFQTFIQRGDLQISVSTNGKSPATARLIREKLEQDFPPEWDERLQNIAAKRTEWKANGDSYDEVNKKTEEFVKSHNWLK